MVRVNLSKSEKRSINIVNRQVSLLWIILAVVVAFASGATVIATYLEDQQQDPSYVMRVQAKSQGMALFEGCMTSVMSAGLEAKHIQYRVSAVKCRILGLVKERALLQVVGMKLDKVTVELQAAEHEARQVAWTLQIGPRSPASYSPEFY